MGEHTKLPWMAASKYSSIVGVPIVNQQGRRVANTSLPGLPSEWDSMKRQAEIDAAFIVKAVNSHEALVKRLHDIIAANNEFRKGMPDGWEGDPLQDACHEAAKLLLPLK